MRRFLAVRLICLFGCGADRLQLTFRPGRPVFTVTGFVAFVEFTTMPNSAIVVTSITFLLDFSPATTVVFSGDLTQQLFVNDFARVNFTQGPNCATAWTIFYDCCSAAGQN
jgi:hypothetical protein